MCKEIHTKVIIDIKSPSEQVIFFREFFLFRVCSYVGLFSWEI
jgi:hypothetical protein